MKFRYHRAFCIAINNACTCGGEGPFHGFCPACRVYHQLCDVELEAPAERACELLTTEERAKVVATWQARHKGQFAADETWALNNLACDLDQAQREKLQKGRR